jgi:hypothetical protein
MDASGGEDLMNPNPFQMAALRDRHEWERRAEDARRERLHLAAVARRRKAKRGGKR